MLLWTAAQRYSNADHPVPFSNHNVECQGLEVVVFLSLIKEKDRHFLSLC